MKKTMAILLVLSMLLSLMAAVIVGAVTIIYNLVAKRLDDVV